MMYNKAIDYYISYCLKPVIVKIHEGYPNSIFWVKDGKVITEIQNSEYFWLRNDIWKSISRMFNINYAETQSVIKIWLKQHHNLSGLRPRFWCVSSVMELEEHYDFR